MIRYCNIEDGVGSVGVCGSGGSGDGSGGVGGGNILRLLKSDMHHELLTRAYGGFV
jgi:hypothetical protein